MKRFIALMTTAVLAASIFSSCGKSGTSGHNSEVSEPSTAEMTTEAVKAEIKTVLPVLSIETKSKDAGVMDFVNEPVSRHVAESIASWTPGYTIPPEPYYEDCTITLKDSNGIVLLSPSNAKVKVRGNWTTVYPKKPLRIKFEEKQGVLGLNDGAKQKNWLLLAEYKDASMLRNKASLYAAREILSQDGLFAADSDFVQVEINGEYYGVYLLTDMQQAGKNRVDITETEKDYAGTDTGYFLEFDGYYVNEDELHGFPLDFAGNAALDVYNGTDEKVSVKALPEDEDDPKKPVGVTIKSDIYSKEQHDFIANFVNKTYTIMYEAAYNNKAFVFDEGYADISETTDITPREAIEKVVDVQSLADMYIISELTCDADIYWSSFFMDADFGKNGSKKLTFEAPWDFDSGLGNKNRCIDGQGFYASNVVPDVNGEYNTINPWLVVLANTDWYQEIVRNTWTKAYDGGVFERTFKLIEDDKTRLEGDFVRNYEKWNNIIDNDDFENELSLPAKSCKTEAEAADFLLKWLRSRVDFLNSQWHI